MIGAAVYLWGLLAGAYGPGVDRLGHPDYATREAAGAGLRAAGAWAYPAIARGLTHASPEVTARCVRLAARYRAVGEDAAAWWLLVGPAPDWWLVWCDDGAFDRLVGVIDRAGLAPPADCPEAEAGRWWADPDWLAATADGARRALAARGR